MSALHIVELRPELPALLRFVRGQGLDPVVEDKDLGYGMHIWLTSAFGEMAPKPWRLFLRRRQPTRLLGYSPYSADSLRKRLRELSDPSAFVVCPDPEVSIASRTMPVWRAGRRLGFEVQCCPVGRKANLGVEKDIFLIRADAAGKNGLEREAVYCDWVRERLERGGATAVSSIGLAGFRLVRLLRQDQRTGRRRHRHLTRPQALLRGEFRVADPDTFRALLAHGVGRHRAFGYGMLLLRPSA